MAFTDPVSLDIGGDLVDCTRVSVGDFKSTYLDPTGTVGYSASSTYGRRTRSTIRLDYKTLVANPELPTTNNPISMSAYLVIDRNAVGFSPALLKGLAVALIETMAADDYEQIAQVLTGQS